LLAQSHVTFFFLDKKKVTKEKSRLQRILGLLFFALPTQYNSVAALLQTVLLTTSLRSKSQNSRFFPKFSEAIRNPIEEFRFLYKGTFLNKSP